jgi:hypothetical protein
MQAPANGEVMRVDGSLFACLAFSLLLIALTQTSAGISGSLSRIKDDGQW